jgi:excisionase family DNA binding protein
MTMRPRVATAEELILAMKGLPTEERVRFFTLLGENVFEKENFSHDEVFGEVAQAQFTVGEAAEYLEVSVPTFRRYVQGKKISPAHVLGRNQLFAAQDLKSFKRSLQDVKRH